MNGTSRYDDDHCYIHTQDIQQVFKNGVIFCRMVISSIYAAVNNYKIATIKNPERYQTTISTYCWQSGKKKLGSVISIFGV